MNKIKPKRIGIDARFYGPLGKGLGRYTQEIVDNIIKIDKENEYVVFLRKENFDEFQSDNPKVKKILADVRWYSIAEQILMPFYIWRAKVDLMHFPHFNVPIFSSKRFIITIHDLILTKFSTIRATTLHPLLYKIKNLFYRIIIWLAVKRAKKIIVVSNFTKEDIMKNFKVRPDKIKVIYEGVANLAKGGDSLFAAKLESEETLFRHNIKNPFLLYVGNAYPHKNLEGLIDVFGEIIKTPFNKCPLRSQSEARGEGGFKDFYNPLNPPLQGRHLDPPSKGGRGGLNNLRLVLVGRDDYFYKRLKNYAAGLGLWEENDLANSRVVFPGYVPDAQLEILYKKAIAYVFPSFYEGFGLPPLEAMAKGCPVASSDKTCLPEVLGDAAIYFNPENKEEMKARIEKIINDENLRVELIKKGYEQVKKYNWWEAARETLGVYEEVLK
jgi:glycosyltransferase involved in cell wall biosynthesis